MLVCGSGMDVVLSLVCYITLKGISYYECYIGAIYTTERSLFQSLYQNEGQVILYDVEETLDKCPAFWYRFWNILLLLHQNSLSCIFGIDFGICFFVM